MNFIKEKCISCCTISDSENGMCYHLAPTFVALSILTFIPIFVAGIMAKNAIAIVASLIIFSPVVFYIIYFIIYKCRERDGENQSLIPQQHLAQQHLESHQLLSDDSAIMLSTDTDGEIDVFGEDESSV